MGTQKGSVICPQDKPWQFYREPYKWRFSLQESFQSKSKGGRVVQHVASQLQGLCFDPKLGLLCV